MDDAGSDDCLGNLLAVPSPCDACQHRARCTEGQAYRAFEVFVVYGGRRWEAAARQPTAERFRRLFEEAAESSEAA